MYIGELARLSGATPKAIRLYESLGLIPIPRRQGKYRIYSQQDIVLVHMVRRGQAVGFSLAEMKELVNFRTQTSQFSLAIANRLISDKRERLQAEKEMILSLEKQLSELHEELNRTFG